MARRLLSEEHACAIGDVTGEKEGQKGLSMVSFLKGDQVKVVAADDDDKANIGQIGVIRQMANGFLTSDGRLYPTVAAVVFPTGQEKVFHPDQLERVDDPSKVFSIKMSEYQECVKRTCAATSREDTLKLALIGLQGELGEVAEPIKKHLWGGHELDCVRLREEIGDVCWYLATLCTSLGISLDDALQANSAKLLSRYPEGFSVEMSQHRNV